MAGALTVAGTFTGNVYRKRQILEHSGAWETGLRQISGVIPPRTRIDPFIEKMHPVIKDREIPIYASGAMLSQIVPGSKHDPYANPPPTKEQWAAEDARLDALYANTLASKIWPNTKEEREWELQKNKEYAQAKEAEQQFVFRSVYRNDPLAEYYRVKAYQKLHPEAVLDEKKFATIDYEKLKHWRD
jgi:hypothetical protein